MDPVLFVAGIDPLRAVAGKNVPVVHQTSAPRDNRPADGFCAARAYRALRSYRCFPPTPPPPHRGGGSPRRRARLSTATAGGGHGEDIDIGCASVICDRCRAQWA